MQVSLKYLGKSGVSGTGDERKISFAPNLARPKVFFDADVKHPLRYREAMSALHDIVVSDLRFKKRSGSEAYKEFLKGRNEAEAKARREAFDEEVKKALLKEPEPPPLDLDKRFHKMHEKYWKARRAWAAWLSSNDPELFRHLVPCDPVVTVAPDVVFFEGFAKDESSYGCLLVDRDAFKGDSAGGMGTTNVDYSNALYRQIQTLRTYRTTRLVVDPTGFEVNVEGQGDYREEKIDLPPTWLRAFGQLSAATTLPTRSVRLDVGTVYAIIAYLLRHREKKGPRSLRFQLTPGKHPIVTIEPFGLEVTSSGPLYDGPKPEEIKVWGRRRLTSLARVLPLAEHVDVSLLGSGLPSIWTAHLGDMRFVLGLSGWTTSDWSSGAGLDLLSGAFDADPALAKKLDAHLESVRFAKLADLEKATGAPEAKLTAALFLLAKQGQAIFDFAHGVYRHRPVLSVALSDELLGPEPPELVGARNIVRSHAVRITKETNAAGLRILVGQVGDEREVELALDSDGMVKKGRCNCSWHFRFKLRQGPCRHLLALRMFATTRESAWRA
ncbi:MAG: SWIM zinc finger family protein [Deltaproteobacteria bacterium]|nr:SWIM zinc finger family protein [Deltaproteobacteria bacterium]